MAPHQRRLTGIANHVSHLLASLLNSALFFGPLLPKIGGRHGEQHPLRDGVGLDQMVNLVQRRQDEPTIIKAKV